MRAQPTTPERKQANRVQHFVTILLVMGILGLGKAMGQSQAPSADPNQAFPFTGVINGSDVHVRSGAGTQTYRCAKLNQGDTVLVLGEQQGWSRIVPPLGCFSWIAMQYVKLSVSEPSMAVVTGAKAMVYAGSDLVEPMHSTSEQGVLPRGTKVRLINEEEKDGYFKIEPPKGSSLWVSSLYVKKMDQDLLSVPHSAGPVVTPSVGDETLPVVPIAPESRENELLKAYHVLQAKTMAEVPKPLAEQDYTEIKKELGLLVADEKAGNVKRYAEYLIKRIEGYELAQQAMNSLKDQDEALAENLSKIEKARREKMKGVSNMGKFAVVGTFHLSNVYNTAQIKRYRIKDDSGRTLCYAEATGALLEKDLNAYTDKKVGLVGKIVPYTAISGALVKFTEIVELP